MKSDKRVAPLPNESSEEKKPREKNRFNKLLKKILFNFRKTLSIPGCLCGFVLILFFAIVSIGGVGFILFLSSSIGKAVESRDFSFELIKKRVDDILVVPKTLTKTITPIIEGGIFNYSTSPYTQVRDIAYNSLNGNFDYFGFEEMMVFVALYDEEDDDNESVVFSWMYGTGDHYFYRSWSGMDTIYELIKCKTNRDSPECLEAEVTLYRNPNSSISHHAKSFTGPTYYPYIYCPDIADENNVCDILIAYAIPVFAEGSSVTMIGSTGFIINARGLSLFLEEIVSSSALSFVIDADTNYLLASNRENSDELTLNKDLTNLVASQKSVFDCGDSEIEDIAVYLRDRHDGSLQNIPLNEKFSLTYKGRSYIDYYRKVNDGFDTVVIHKTSVFGFIWQSLFFGFVLVVFTLFMLIVNCCIGLSVIICVNREIKKLLNSFEKIEYGLRFEEVNYDKFSPVYDIAKIQKKFYYLVKKLKEYSAFLPSSVLEKERMIIHESSVGGSTVSQSENMSEVSGDYQISSINGGASSSSVNTGTTSSTTSSIDEDSMSTSSDHDGKVMDKHDSVASSKSKRSNASSGSRNLTKRNIRKQLKRVSRFALSQSLAFKEITLVKISFDYNGQMGGFIHYHSNFSENVESCMKAKRGSIVQMAENRFLIGFNVTIPVREHSKLAVEFALELLSKTKNEKYCEVNIAVVTGGSSVGILGSSNQKREVVFGEILSQSEQLLRHSIRLECPLLINGYCKDDLRVSDYRIDTRDVVFFYPWDKLSEFKRRRNENIERVYSVRKLENWSDEWMYEKQRKDIVQQGKDDEKLWDLIEMNQGEELLNRIEGRKDLVYLKEIASSLKTVVFSQYMKEAIQKKLQFLEGIRNLSIFNFDNKERMKSD